MDQSTGPDSDSPLPDETAEQRRSGVEFGIYSPRTLGPKIKSERKLNLSIIGASAAVIALIVGIGAFVLLRASANKAPVLGGRGANPPAVVDDRPALEVGGRTAESSDAQQPTDAKEITTSQGVLRIERARLTNKYTECPNGGGQCKEVSGGNKYLLILTLKSVEGRNTQSFHDQLAVEAFNSYIKTPDGQSVGVTNVGGAPPSSSTDIYFSYLYSAKGEGLILYWPGNAPIRLAVTGL